MKRFLVAALLVVAVALVVGVANAQQSGPGLAGETHPSYTLLAPTRLEDETLYTASPALRWSRGLDMSLSKGFAGADVFVSAVGDGDDWGLVATVEVSPDGTHWAPVVYETTRYVENNVLAVVTTPPVERRLSRDDAAGVFMVALVGQYLRVKLDATGIVTPTVSVTYRPYLK